MEGSMTTHEMPECFPSDSVAAINRIVNRHNVLGVLYFQNNSVLLSTVPESIKAPMSNNIPGLSLAVYRAITEIDILNEMVAYRIMTKTDEIMVVGGKDYGACATESLNMLNPMVDRIMEDESIKSVIMTNQEGNPILTNTNVMSASQFGLKLHGLGIIIQREIKNLDPFDEVLAARISTKKHEIILTPTPDFNLIAVQKTTLKI